MIYSHDILNLFSDSITIVTGVLLEFVEFSLTFSFLVSFLLLSQFLIEVATINWSHIPNNTSNLIVLLVENYCLGRMGERTEGFISWQWNAFNSPAVKFCSAAYIYLVCCWTVNGYCGLRSLPYHTVTILVELKNILYTIQIFR